MNDALAAVPRRYALSFTTGALLAREAVLLAPVYVEQRDWERVRDLGVKDNLLAGRGRHRTGSPSGQRETVQRLCVVLADDEIEFLIEATASERASPHVGCRLPTLRVHRRVRRGGRAGAISSFCLDAGLPGTSIASSEIKALWHEELAAITDSTLQRLRRNVFKMLREADLLSEASTASSARLSCPGSGVASVLSSHSPSDLRFFPTQQTERQRASL